VVPKTLSQNLLVLTTTKTTIVRRDAAGNVVDVQQSNSILISQINLKTLMRINPKMLQMRAQEGTKSP
jgi:hypothetical protein